MEKIRVDQSHCNYYLVQFLKSQGWKVLFVDSGRASRGGTGTQGECLRIFEEPGLPIPDIVAALEDQLLLVEIDSALNKAHPSLKTYKLQEKFLLEKFNDRLFGEKVLTSLKTAFCRTNIARSAKNFFNAIQSQENNVDLWIAFEQPQIPMWSWIKPDVVEK